MSLHTDTRYEPVRPDPIAMAELRLANARDACRLVEAEVRDLKRQEHEAQDLLRSITKRRLEAEGAASLYADAVEAAMVALNDAREGRA